MSLPDKIGTKAEDAGGKAEEVTGEAVGNDRLAAEGRADQAKAALEEGVEKVKDAVGGLVGKIAENFRR